MVKEWKKKIGRGFVKRKGRVSSWLESGEKRSKKST